MPRRGVDLPPDDRTAIDSLSLLANKWHPVVLLTLEQHGTMGFNELLELLPDVSGKVLSSSLEGLQEAGLVDRNIVNEAPLRVTYELTDAGSDLRPVFDALATWGTTHLEQATPRVLLADADRRITDMYRQWLTHRYTVSRAHSADEVEEALEEPIDVFLLDDRLPGSDTIDLLESVSETSRTIVLVGDRPDFDLLELPCDDVLRKPIVKETALDTIETQLSRMGVPSTRRTYDALRAKCALLESSYSIDRLEANDTYCAARTRLEDLETDLEN